MTIVDKFDHDVSLLSALAYLALMAYAAYITLALQLGLLIPSSRDWSFFPRTSKYQVASTLTLVFLALDGPLLLRSPGDDGLADLVQGWSPKLNEILEKVPSIRQGPSPPFYLRNRHVQFLPWIIQNRLHERQGLDFQRIELDVTDCYNKMRDCDGQGPMSTYMNDTITLDVFPPFNDESPWSKGFDDRSPIIFMVPGLRSHSLDLPGVMIVKKAHERGFRSVVVNRRGHTPNQLLKSPRWNLFGDVDDFEQVYWHVKNELVPPNTPLFLYGISSGTAIPVSAISKWDKRRVEEPDRASPSFVAVVAVTPGYDISRALTRERFTWPYTDLMLNSVKQHFVVKNEALLRSFNNEAVDDVLSATSLSDLVEKAVPFAGYDDTDSFYEDSNPVNHVRSIQTPNLVLNAVDDPCCIVGNLYERSPYPVHENMTYAEMAAKGEHTLIAVTRTGSHCPFLCARHKWLPFVKDPISDGWMLNSWADQVSIDYFVAALEVYSDRRFM